jgi:hypothetical protein
LEDAPRRTTVDPQRLVQRTVERSVVVTELLPKPLLRLGVDEVGRRGVGMFPGAPRVRRATTRLRCRPLGAPALRRRRP